MVSEDTIRRDLKELADHGHLKKIHGGAIANIYAPLNLENSDFHQEKKMLAVAEKAQYLFVNHQVIIMNGGTINLKLLQFIPENLSLTIVTNSLMVALKLCNFHKIDTVFLGGTILKKEQVSIGMDVKTSLTDIHADVCLLDTCSIHPDSGLSDINREEASTKKAMMQAAERVVSLVTSERIGTVKPFKINKINQIHTLISELNPKDLSLMPFIKKGLQVL